MRKLSNKYTELRLQLFFRILFDPYRGKGSTVSLGEYWLIDNDHQIKLEPSFAGEEEIDIDANPPEDSKECINKKLQNNDLTIINFVHIKEEGSKDYINENKQNNELQLSSSTSFPPIKEEIKFVKVIGNNYNAFGPCLSCVLVSDWPRLKHDSLSVDVIMNQHIPLMIYHPKQMMLHLHGTELPPSTQDLQSEQRKYKCDVCDKSFKRSSLAGCLITRPLLVEVNRTGVPLEADSSLMGCLISCDELNEVMKFVRDGGKIREAGRKFNVPHSTLLLKLKNRMVGDQMTLKPFEFKVEQLLYFESVMNGGRAEEFRVSDAKGWEGDESAKELFHVWKKLRRKCVGEQTETSFGMSNSNIKTGIINQEEHLVHNDCSTKSGDTPEEELELVATPSKSQAGEPIILLLLILQNTGLYSLRANRPVPRLTLSFQIRSKSDATLEALIGQESAPKPPPPLKDHKCKNRPLMAT
uniref:HTH psq-type domain-containing protein n=1 Tax=Timema douglasi TaxID=61478 RepID=A0A7R8VU20_TIMDO|nr:unnamed protein product [Timema douglasi]